MPSISSPGLGSGLDVGGLVDRLVAAEIQPASTRLDRREIDLQTELSAFGSLKSALSSLQDNLKILSEVGAGRTATSSDTDVISVSATESAVVGAYDIEVGQLAKAHSLASQAYASTTDVVGTGTLTIRFGTTDYNALTDNYNGFTDNLERPAQTLVIDETNNTLEGVRDAINEAEIGVNAVIVNDGTGYRLLLSSEATGEANSLQISVSDDGGSGLTDLTFDGTATNLDQTIAAQDAQLIINGLSVSSASNSVSEVVDGLTFELKSTNSGVLDELVRIDVARDKAAVGQAVDSFIEEYNALVDQIATLTSYNTETQQASPLTGDSSVRSITSQLRNGLVSAVDGASEVYSYLTEIGVSSDRNGKLSRDSSRFDTALDQDFEGVVALVNGAAENLEAPIGAILETGGILDSRTEGLQTRIEGISDQRLVLERRAEALQARYLKQFTALDTLLAQLQTTSNFLGQQLASIPTAADLSNSS